MTRGQSLLLLIARAFLASLFLWAGWGKLMAAGATAATFAKVGLPAPWLAYWVAVVIEVGGGLAILLGVLARPVGLGLAVYCVATALLGHFNFADRNTEIHFFKNMTMTGGFLYVAAFGAGAYSLDAVWRRRGDFAI